MTKRIEVTKINENEAVEIRNFELRFDGSCHIVWKEGEIVHRWYIVIWLSDLYKMLEIEGVSLEDIKIAERNYKPLIFRNVVLICEKQSGMYTAAFFDQEFGNTLMKEKFYVELCEGDSLKNYRHMPLMASVELKNSEIK